MNIVKRNGEIVKFDAWKIRDAILKAMKHGSGTVDVTVAEQIAMSILDYFMTSHVETPTIDDVLYRLILNRLNSLHLQSLVFLRVMS